MANKKVVKVTKKTSYGKSYLTILAIILAVVAVSRIVEQPIVPDITGQVVVEEITNGDKVPVNEVNGGVAEQKTEKPELMPDVNKMPSFEKAYDFKDSEANVLEVVDLNKDGYDDVVIGSADIKTKVFLNNQDNTFSFKQLLAFSKTTAIAAGDFDNNGYVDVALGTNDERNYIYYNDGENFKAVEMPDNALSRNLINDLAVADFDNNGFLDIAAARQLDGNVLYINDGAAGFVNSRQFGKYRTEQIMFADFDNDGWQDVLLANYNQNSKIFWNRATRMARLFDESNVTTDVGTFLREVSLCDINNDGNIDFVSANYEQENSIYYNNGDRTFREKRAFDKGNSVSILCADMNNDGWQDVIVSNYNEQSYLYLNNKDSFFRVKLNIPGNINYVRAADVNGDKYPDLIIGRYTDSSQAWINTLG